ncbi:MAG TPA: NACHT domain-containing protein, partial [Saprospiraceae bacterium]|nr:NACHT domain-containing protein [Saprospiraceae bacterium]
QSQFFTPLEAEVEMIREKGGKKRKITNVFDAIKSSKGQTILLLGEPGSGKSVTLRKLCKEIAEESAETGRIPIYINLKDWKTNWDAEGRPTTLSLMKFIETYIGDNFNFIVSKFLFSRLDENNTVFEKLYETDRLYFIFDSFDEIPAILSSENNADIIHHLSEVIFKFLKSGRSQKAQGILASRLYKKPTREFITNTILELRPFSDEKIFRTLENLGFYSKEKIREIFATRPDLVSMARNPFMSALLANYSEKNRARFPESKKELFDDFIKNTINEKVGLAKYEGLDFDTVFQFAVRIADYMYNKLGDLEIDVFYLGTQEPRQPVKQIISLLTDTRVMRGGIAHGDKVSFVHRRFAEYFIINRPNNEYDLNSIGNLGKWHDALILYSEIADEEEAARIANRAWDNIKDKNTILDLEFINSFRFLIESFSFRKAPMKAFIGDLKQMIFGVIERSRNILELKLVVEGIGLLDNEDIDDGVSKVLQFNNPWLSETAIRSCRHLPRITKRLEGNILNYVSEMELVDFVKNLSALRFSFGLSQSFQKGRKIVNIKLFETILFFVLIISLFYYFSISGWFHLQFAVLVGISLTYFTLKSNLSLNNAKGVLGIIFVMLLVTEMARNGWQHMTSCEEPHLQVLFFLLLAIIPISKFSISYLFLRSRITLSDVITVITYSLLTMLLYFISINTRSFSKFFEGPIKSILYTIAPFIFLITYTLIEHYNINDYFILKKIDKKQCNQREYIYAVLQSVKSRHFRSKFLSYLEFNVDYAIGEWP